MESSDERDVLLTALRNCGGCVPFLFCQWFFRQGLVNDVIAELILARGGTYRFPTNQELAWAARNAEKVRATVAVVSAAATNARTKK